jgi:peptidoglycan/LPS O-acetylase OafA/YrhL
MQDRLIRIYPVLWATIFVIVGLGVATGAPGYGAAFVYPKAWLRTMAWLLPVNLLGLPGVVPWPNIHPAAWTLSYELFFYGFCALAWAVRRRLGMRMCLILAIPAGSLMVLFNPRAMLFLSGVIVALGAGRLRPIAVLARWPLPFVLAFLLLWRRIEDIAPAEPFNQTTLIEWAGDWRMPLAIFALIAVTVGFAGIVAEGGGFSRMLRWPALQFMGTISYSFYLWHPIIMAVVKHAMLRSGLVDLAGPASQLLFLLLSLPSALLVGWLSQRVLEQMVGARLRRWVKQARDAQDPARNSPLDLNRMPVP